MDRRLSWIWLAQACGAASKSAVNLLCAFGSPEKIFKADRKALAAALHDDGAPVLSRLARKDLSDASAILRRCEEAGIQIVTPDDEAYPRSLYQLRDAPVVLYCVGHLPRFDDVCVCAVVGTRKMSDYGRRMAYDIGRGLAAGGALLVSGLALGVDGMAMAGALSAGGTTLGVLGCGVDIAYPPEHRDLMKRVLQNGAVLSEYPPGTPPDRFHFPKRNRIISGLSHAVVVVEGDRKSGSLITARHALYQGRDLYAVPGMIGDAGAEGPNLLIKSGARAITSALDVLQNYEFLFPHTLRMSAAEEELSRPSASEDVSDAAVRMNVFASDSKKYYGGGLYGGRAVPGEKPGAKSKKIPPKKMVERFRESDPPKKTEPVEPKRIDFDSLGETEKKIYAAFTPDVPIRADDIPVKGIEMPELLAGLTMLELAGAIECGAGSYYIRRSADQPRMPEE